MGYYTDKKKSFSFIASLCKTGTSLDLIYYKVENEFGFGAKVVRNRLDLMERLGAIEIKDGIISRGV